MRYFNRQSLIIGSLLLFAVLAIYAISTSVGGYLLRSPSGDWAWLSAAPKGSKLKIKGWFHMDETHQYEVTYHHDGRIDFVGDGEASTMQVDPALVASEFRKLANHRILFQDPADVQWCGKHSGHAGQTITFHALGESVSLDTSGRSTCDDWTGALESAAGVLGDESGVRNEISALAPLMF